MIHHTSLFPERERERASLFFLSFFPGGAKRERERERDGRVALGFEKRERERVLKERRR